jgi:hypothetical protein
MQKKVLLKNTLYFWKYKKDKFLTEKYTIVLLFYYYLLLEIFFFIFSKIQHIFNGTFLHTLVMYISIYIFNLIIFEDIKVWDFKIFKILKMEEVLEPMCTKSLLVD